ncbi:MAG TPA: hypothetical protein VFL12_12625 [Thermoanaerobaculia bacterium]|nr:hypothetical protein [Thermoanaerobaculia bacterium]
MIGGIAVAGAIGVAAAVGAMAWKESRWRRLAAAELAQEVDLGALSSRDLRALASAGRFRRDWLADRRERRAFRRIAGRLARAKVRQRESEGERRRLLQVEILTLRTRLRRASLPPTGPGEGRLPADEV